MTSKRMQENALYIAEWKTFNPNLKDSFFLEQDILYKDASKEEKVLLKDIYLPDLLKNENFRKKVLKMSKDNLFEIIKLQAQTSEILKQEDTPRPILISYQILKEIPTYAIIFEDSNHQKFKYKTPTPEKIIDLYETIKNKQGEVTLTELGSEIKNATLTNRI